MPDRAGAGAYPEPKPTPKPNRSPSPNPGPSLSLNPSPNSSLNPNPRRGQNRTAPQSFDQDFENLTNAALRQNSATGEPVRVIRGPKLQGGHGTGESGGGYRYDAIMLL